MNYLEVMENFSNAFGPSGFEEDVVAVARKYGPQNALYTEDSLRNLYIERPCDADSTAPVVMLDCHTDEVGFMVQSVRPNGLLQIIPLGGWVEYTIPAHRVLVRSRKGEIYPGIVTTKPPHYLSEAERSAKLNIANMTVDIGATSAQEVEESFDIGLGCPIAPDTSFEYTQKTGLVLGKAFDCRGGCAAVVSVMNKLEDTPLQVRPVAALASQEEVGMRGAVVTARRVKPDVAIAFEGVPADDTFTEGWNTQTALHKGPMLRHIDNGMITNPRFLRFTLDLAKEQGIPVQEAVRTGGCTNGASIHLAGQGIPTIVIGLPVRYIHSHYGFASFADYQNCISLGMAVIQALTPEIIQSF